MERHANGLPEIASCVKRQSISVIVFILDILPCNYISLVTRLIIKEINNKLKLSCSVNSINFIKQGINWIQMSGSFNQSRSLLFVYAAPGKKVNFVRAKSIYTSVKNRYWFKNKNKTYKSVTTFSLNKADFPTLTSSLPVNFWL